MLLKHFKLSNKFNNTYVKKTQNGLVYLNIVPMLSTDGTNLVYSWIIIEYPLPVF